MVSGMGSPGLEKKDVQLFQLACLTNTLRKGAILLIYVGTFLTTLQVMADDFCQPYICSPLNRLAFFERLHDVRKQILS
jgi:hypothetical protein